ncbi:MAG: peptidylprolyl isomerase [Clostridia bacterium]|nr:peptidylprolyl isomerase [Clostridia bacterium]
MYNNPQGRAAILKQLVASKLILLDARRNLYETEAAYKEQLSRLKENLLINYATEKIVGGVTVSDEEAEAYYGENLDKLGGGETVNASHILVKTEEEAKELLSKINDGTISFEDAAKEHSTCPSGKSGGSLGDFGRGQMVPEFDAAVFAMNEGEISAEPVKTQFGYHLIKLNSKGVAQAPAFEAMKEQIKSYLIGEKQSKAYESRINQLKILYPVEMA